VTIVQVLLNRGLTLPEKHSSLNWCKIRAR